MAVEADAVEDQDAEAEDVPHAGNQAGRANLDEEKKQFQDLRD